MESRITSNNPTSNEIVNKIKKKIFSGEYKINQRLVETAIAEEHNVNKFHVHKAFQQLAAEGLLQYKPRRGFFVIGIDENDFLEIVKIREIMENAIIEKFFEAANKDVFDKCIRIIKRKLAFLKSGLVDDADVETVKFFKEVNNVITFKHIPRLLQQYQRYLMSIIHTDFKIREDVNITISTTEVLLEALVSNDVVKANDWVTLRHDNLVKSCHTNIEHIHAGKGPMIDNEYNFQQ